MRADMPSKKLNDFLLCLQAFVSVLVLLSCRMEGGRGQLLWQQHHLAEELIQKQRLLIFWCQMPAEQTLTDGPLGVSGMSFSSPAWPRARVVYGAVFAHSCHLGPF